MTYEEFIDQVEQQTIIRSRDQAVEATRVTLETLGERLSLHRTELRHLVSQVPDELKGLLRRRTGRDHYTLEEFFRRVAARLGVGYPEAFARAHAVLGVLRQMIPEGERKHILGELPAEFKELIQGEGEPPVPKIYTGVQPEE